MSGTIAGGCCCLGGGAPPCTFAIPPCPSSVVFSGTQTLNAAGIAYGCTASVAAAVSGSGYNETGPLTFTRFGHMSALIQCAQAYYGEQFFAVSESWGGPISSGGSVWLEAVQSQCRWRFGWTVSESGLLLVRNRRSTIVNYWNAVPTIFVNQELHQVPPPWSPNDVATALLGSYVSTACSGDVGSPAMCVGAGTCTANIA